MSYSTLLCPALGAQYEYLQTLFRGGSLVLGLKGLQWTTGIFCWFNVTRLFFSPLIASANSCSFLFLSSIYLSAFFVLGLFMYNFMWFIKLRAWAGMCEGVHRCLQVCLGMHGCVRVCVGEHWCARICFGMHRCALVCRCVWGYVQVYAGMHGRLES